MRGLVIAAIVGLVALTWSTAAGAQTCERHCAPALRDERGCCPARALPGDAAKKEKEKARPKNKAKAGASVNLGKLPPLCKDVKACNERCLGNDLGACVRLGDLYFEAAGVKRDVDKAETKFKSACEAGSGIGCEHLAWLADRGIDRKADDAYAAKGYRKACELGDGGGCALLARMQVQREVEPGDGEPAKLIARAEDLLIKACNANDDDACDSLALYIYDSTQGLAPDAAKAGAAWVRVAAYADARCKQGARDKCALFALLRAVGRGVDQDLDASIADLLTICQDDIAAACGFAAMLQLDVVGSRNLTEPYRKAAERGCGLGEPRACLALATVRLHDSPGEQTLKDVMPDVARACRGGDADACLFLDRVLRTKRPKDAEAYLAMACEADWARCGERWGTDPITGEIEKAEPGDELPHVCVDLEMCQAECDKKVATSCTHLGEMYEWPIALKYDPVKAQSLFTTACELGDAEGCDHAGGALLAGRGMPVDRKEAFRLLNLACNSGYSGSCMTLAAEIKAGRADGDADKLEQVALAMAIRGCDAGNDTACGSVMDFYRKDGAFPDEKKFPAARDRFLDMERAYCEQGIVGRCGILALYTYVYLDKKTGLPLLEQACTAGDAVICWVLVHIAWDKETKEGDRQAVVYAERGCSLGDPEACGQLGLIFLRGLGGYVVDAARGVKLLEYGCWGGDSWSCDWLTGIYEGGKFGPAADAEKAEQYRRRSCETLGEACKKK
jgi:hypothetical protein